MKTRIAILIGIVALIVGGVIFAVGQGRPAEGQRPPGRDGMPPPPPPGIPDLEHLTRALNLTEAQSAELKPFFDSERATIDALTKKIEESHQQIQAATKDGHFEETQVRALAVQLAQAQADVLVEHARFHAKLYNVLTPEQRANAEQMHGHGGHHGPGGPGGMMPPPPPPRPDN